MNFWDTGDRKALEEKMRREGRLPPGQSLTLKWPVLHYANVPSFDPNTWEFRTAGWVEKPIRLTWSAFQTLPRLQVTADFHCVTRWSRFDNNWEGVSFRTLYDMTQPKPGVTHVMVHCQEGYTTNVPLADLLKATFCSLISMMASRSRPSTAVRCAWWCQSSTAGRAPSG